MNVLILGNGGREHALAVAIARSPKLTRLYTLPGNAGTAAVGTNLTGDPGDVKAVVAAARERSIDFVVVGPEAPLCAGVVDALSAAGIRAFGPKRAAARIEGDKAYAKELMRRARVPTAEARIFENFQAAHTYTATRENGLVVKASGLAAGKGVIVCDEPSDALIALEQMMVERRFGDAGNTVIVEERLQGPEVSVLALVDENTIYVLETAQDYKRLGDGDSGPNTGGMGAHSPSPRVTDELLDRVQADVLVPIIDALRGEDVQYCGVLYAGLMLTAAGPKVLEFNCRFGDPEAQVVLPRFRGDLLSTLVACADNQLADAEIDWDPRPAVTVVLASGGYPGKYETGKAIRGLAEAEALDDVTVYHAGTRLEDGVVLTNGGRVLAVTALGTDVAAARAQAYRAADLIHFDGVTRREDIAAN
ncbi:MAG: phosphoribosylamine--glycine ligase [Phycisphaerales bacterium]|nr:phosphoribosylamine--glycine ligase [Phycisphaerales bacterium]